MGTSANHPSPNTPSWRIVKAVLGRANIEPELQSREIWRAALADRGGRLSDELGDAVIAAAAAMAGRARSPIDAIAAFESTLESERKAGLHLDIARRALARAVVQQSGEIGFARELFSEVASYYASRDLPSVIAAKDRVPNASSSIALKTALRQVAKDAVGTIERVRTDAKGWKSFVNKVVRQLRG